MGDAIERLAIRFRDFGEIHIPDMSPFSAFLSVKISEDAEILSVCAAAGPGQPAPNLLFASVRFLLDQGYKPELLHRYPTAFGTVIDPSIYDHFREFVLGNRDQIEHLLATKRVQSNVVRRCGILLPGLMRVAAEFENRSFTNIEIGASAGMTLLWEQYAYRYGNQERFGCQNSEVEIETELRGQSPFAVQPQFPEVATNIGIEFDLIDDSDETATDWLKALIFPEHEDNRLLFDGAIGIAKNYPPRVLGGDALVLLPKLLANLPAGHPVSVYHSHTLNQFSVEAREFLDSILNEASLYRDVIRLGFEATPHGYSDLRLVRYAKGVQQDDVLLANCEAHGRWVDWQSNPV